MNIPRYIDSNETEDTQDIEAHLLGGIPNSDIEALQEYWAVFPKIKELLIVNYQLLGVERNGYSQLTIKPSQLKTTIFEHPEFVQFITQMNQVFTHWRDDSSILLKSLEQDFHPKELIYTLSEKLLTAYTDKPLLNKYDVYQHLMNYWTDIMQDDC